MKENSLSTAKAFLAKYQGLEHLAINFEGWIDLIPLNGWRLKGLSVEIQAFHKENLRNLKEFIGQQKGSLEDLHLRLRFEEQPETFLDV